MLTSSSACRVRSASGQRGDLRLSVVYGGSQDVFTALCKQNTGNTMTLTAIIRRMKNSPGLDQKKLSFVQTWRNYCIYPSLIKMEAFFELEFFFFVLPCL